ncbi:hypothetical protein [Clostridium felsineum]|uniref:Uncharacterized protein n=1 Tax=Clostridium felsineum TaxID=36839 RepID=A0A1S8KYA2_9CLOT|nr:hypothetical protein [Clostridium felsineum]URZ05968.1 hypothetical protein CLROS_013000 [Clostridium felsineum]URZ11005.1 hypothetical protein CROST_017210 [Clostridium felsineum]
MSLLSPCNQNSILHIFLLCLYAIPIIFIIYAVISYKLSFSDEIISLFKKIYYIIWILAYIILVNHVELNKISIKDSFGVPYNIWTLIIIFIIFLVLAYLLDIFILFGNGFKELSIFGAKFVKEETKEILDNQHKYLNLLIDKIKAENKIITGLKEYMNEENFKDKIINGKFYALNELDKIIMQYYNSQNIDVRVESVFIKDKKIDNSLICENKLTRIESLELKRYYKNSTSYFLEKKDESILFVPYTSQIYDNDILMIIKTDNNLMFEEQYMILNIITIYEINILNVYKSIK